MHRIPFLFRFCQMSLILLPSIYIQSKSVRQIILEKDISSGQTQRVALFGDEHEFDNANLKEVTDKQAGAISSSFGNLVSIDPSAELYLEACERSHFMLEEQLTKIVSTADSYEPPSFDELRRKRTKLSDEIIKQVTGSVERQLRYDSRLLQKLAVKLYDVPQVKFLDSRSFFSTIINMIDRVLVAVIIKEFQKGKYVLSQLGQIDLTTQGIFDALDAIVNTAKHDVQRLLPTIHDKKIKTYINDFSRRLEAQVQAIKQARASIDTDKQFFIEVTEKAKKAFSLLGAGDMYTYMANSQVMDYIEFWQFYKNADRELMGLFDMSLLANLFESKAKHVLIFAGIVHMNILKMILLNEGYKIVYDSQFRVKGHLVNDDTEHAALKMGKPELWSTTDTSSELYEPLLDCEFGYVPLSADNLKKKKEIEHAQYENVSSGLLGDLLGMFKDYKKDEI